LGSDPKSFGSPSSHGASRGSGIVLDIMSMVNWVVLGVLGGSPFMEILAFCGVLHGDACDVVGPRVGLLSSLASFRPGGPWLVSMIALNPLNGVMHLSHDLSLVLVVEHGPHLVGRSGESSHIRTHFSCMQLLGMVIICGGDVSTIEVVGSSMSSLSSIARSLKMFRIMGGDGDGVGWSHVPSSSKVLMYGTDVSMVVLVRGLGALSSRGSGANPVVSWGFAM